MAIYDFSRKDVVFNKTNGDTVRISAEDNISLFLAPSTKGNGKYEMFHLYQENGPRELATYLEGFSDIVSVTIDGKDYPLEWDSDENNELWEHENTISA